ncbi:MAG: hypothetical protein AB7V19_04920 [Candidatus Bipolaricaulia bacterium]
MHLPIRFEPPGVSEPDLNPFHRNPEVIDAFRERARLIQEIRQGLPKIFSEPEFACLRYPDELGNAPPSSQKAGDGAGQRHAGAFQERADLFCLIRRQSQFLRLEGPFEEASEELGKGLRFKDGRRQELLHEQLGCPLIVALVAGVVLGLNVLGKPTSLFWRDSYRGFH